MIFTDPCSDKIILARDEYLENMLPLIFGRIQKLKDPIAINFFDICVNNKLEDILIGLPNVLLELNSKLNIDHLIIRKAFKKVFDYDWFIDKCINRYDAYRLANTLDVITCTYCNRNYTNTVITKDGEKLIRPQFDHFFDKDSNPLLALSFYNLIPSCSLCNTNIKHGKKFELSSHIHPYLDNIINDFNFNYDYTNTTKNGLKIIIESSPGSKIERTLCDMSVETVYNAHTDQLKDLLDIKSKFSDRYLEILSKSIFGSTVKISQEELYRLAFGTEFLEENFGNRPFSKFKSDILKELNII